MRFLTKITYYAVSIITLLTRFERPFQILGIFIGRKDALPARVTIRSSALSFFVREAMDVWVIKETCIDADYLPPGGFGIDWQIIDVGAGLGDFSIFAAVNCPGGQVFAYEPLEASFELLGRNLDLNGVTNVHAFRQATAANSGTMSPVGLENEAVSTRFAANTAEEVVKATQIPVTTMAELLDRLPDGQCDLMKIDCEGCEFDLLLNSRPELLKRIRRLAIETHDGFTEFSSDHLAVYLRQHGFRVRQKRNPVHNYLGFIYAER